MAWKFIFPRKIETEFSSTVVVCNISDFADARRAAEIGIDYSLTNHTVIAEEFCKEQMALIDIPLGECRRIDSGIITEN